MRKLAFPIIIFSLLFTITSCLRDDCTSTREYTIYNPVYLHVDQFRSTDINVEPSMKLENPGKLYFYNNYLLINEMALGIHIYNVSDRSNPVEVGFYSIPGNFDMAIKDDVLFADNVIDLIAIDISNITNPKIVDRFENYKEAWEPEDQRYHAYNVRSNRVELVDCSDPNFGRGNFWRGGILFADASAEEFGNIATPGASSGNIGVGGSFARFTITQDLLYTVDEYKLTVWSYEGQLNKENTNNLGWGIETIFPYEDKLFIGSNAGMFIFDNSNPYSPVLLSTFEHARACDPVVVDGRTAYVTLRNGSECQGFVNQLDVIDVTSLIHPRLIESYSMTNPHGLAVRNDRLYLGEGSYGLRILDVSDPEDVKKVKFYENIPAYDIISLSDSDIFIVGEGGFYLLDASDINDVKVLSHIRVEKS